MTVASVEVLDCPVLTAGRGAAVHLLALHIVPDARGVATALRDRFAAAHIPATIGSEIPPEATAVAFLRALDPADTDAQETLVLETFRQLRGFAQRHRDGDVQIFLVLDTGGRFGLSTPAPDRALIGALAGLGKTAAREWPKARVRIIDLAVVDSPAATLAQRLFDEITRDDSSLEVGLGAEGRRLVPQLRPVPRPARSFSRSATGGTWVVSGGARGVTAPCLLALARRGPLKFVLLGRTGIDDAEPAEIQGCRTDAELKQALLDAARRRGEAIAPKQLQQRAAAILAAREARTNCEALRALGCEVRYLAVDVADTRAVEAALATVRADWGPIYGLVHAAGVLADKALHEKTDEQFRLVFRTKVSGFRALLEGTAADPLEAICCFSSVAARAGNAGQCDYAAANEALNKLCQVEQARRGSRCRVRAINWGPWDGGMVSPALKSRFAAMGVRLIPIDAGAEIFADIVTGALDVAVESVVGAVIAPPAPDARLQPALSHA